MTKNANGSSDSIQDYKTTENKEIQCVMGLEAKVVIEQQQQEGSPRS